MKKNEKQVSKIKSLEKDINDKETSLCAVAERKMLMTIGGDCDTAVGGLAEINNDNIKINRIDRLGGNRIKTMT